MTIILTPEKAEAVGKAIAAGLIANTDEIVDAGLAAIEYRVPPKDVRPRLETAEEWKRALRQWIEKFASKGPPLTDEAISREAMYEDRW